MKFIPFLLLMAANDVLSAVSLERVPGKLQNKMFVIAVGLIPVAITFAGIYYLSGSQDAKHKITSAAIGAALIFGATGIVAAIKSIM